MNISGKYLWPAAAVLIGGVAAWVTQSTPSPSPAAYATVAAMQVPAPGTEPPGDVGDTAQVPTITGKVLEIINVPKYTYLRIATHNSSAENEPGGEVWAAVNTAELKLGQVVTVVGAQRMENFASSKLNRTFALIYFGALGESSANGTGKLPPGHPNIAGSAGPQVEAAPADHPPAGVDDRNANPHGSPSAGGDQVPVGKIDRAQGSLGHTVAEIVNGRKSLAGRKVRVRGVVVKSTSGVLGKTFAHLRDGSGSAKSGDHDLTVTTEQTATVGATMLFEGTVVTDKDFGAGYSYPVLVENAQTVTE
jgi:hypothetical protein